MRKKIELLTALIIVCAIFFGCASAPQVHYITEAEAVKVEALEPVSIVSAQLRTDIKQKLREIVKSADERNDLHEEFTQTIQKNILKTKRFSDVWIDVVEGDSFTIEPRISSVKELYENIPSDPTRKKFGVTARVKLDVIQHTSDGYNQKIDSFDDTRTKEKKVPISPLMSPTEKVEYYKSAINTAFASAADQLGNKLLPGHQQGEVTKVVGKTVYISMQTPKDKCEQKQWRFADIYDNDNKQIARVRITEVREGFTLATIERLNSGTNVAVGMKTLTKIMKGCE